MPSMIGALLCPNQAREFGTIVNDVPKDIDPAGHSTFSLLTVDEVSFPFQRYGHLSIRRPTRDELETLHPIDIREEEEWIPYPHGDHLDRYNVNYVQYIQFTRHIFNNFMFYRLASIHTSY